MSIVFKPSEANNMDGGVYFDSTIDLKDQLETFQLPDMSTTDLNKDKKFLSNDIPDFSLAYLGPQIWNSTVMCDDLKLVPISLDDLLDEGMLPNDLLDISTILSSDQTQKNTEQEAIGSAEQSAEVSAHSITERNQDLVIYPNTQTFDLPVDAAQDYIGPSVPVTSPQLDDSEERRFSYKPDITDVMISTAVDETGASTEFFDPTKRVFTEDDLKPQPIIRKAKKVYVADDSKDTKYWQKRVKNNVAAKRSRAARRIKENQIGMRTTFLEKENDNLKQVVQELRAELAKMVEVVSGYKAREKGISSWQNE